MSCRFMFAAIELNILLAGCGLHNIEKHDGSSHIKTDSTVQLEELDVLKHQQVFESITLKRDTLNSSYSVQIWPKGKFSYSADHGFEGTAERILINGASMKGNQSISTSSGKEEKEQVVKRSMDVHKRAALVEKRSVKKQLASWKVVLGYCLIVFSLLALFFFWHAVRSKLFLPVI